VPLSVLGLALLTFAALQTHRASKAYANQEAYESALLRDHFDDPGTQYYFAFRAARRANRTELREHLSAMPSPPWPPAIIVPTYKLAVRANDPVKTREAIDAIVATARRDNRCETVRLQLETWLTTAPDSSTAAHLKEALAALPCAAVGSDIQSRGPGSM
jgi:hypothetical protein